MCMGLPVSGCLAPAVAAVRILVFPTTNSVYLVSAGWRRIQFPLLPSLSLPEASEWPHRVAGTSKSTSWYSRCLRIVMMTVWTPKEAVGMTFNHYPIRVVLWSEG